VRQRLLNKARETGRPFSELLQYFAMERFLYRLSKSEHAEKFVLKGALMLTAWNAPMLRPTLDIDLLGRGGCDIEAMVAIVKQICVARVEPEDGLFFDPATVQGERIAETAEYEGVRVRFRATLGAARIQMQIDIGFGDVVVPAAVRTVYPTMLGLPAPLLLAYSKETAIAEKLEAMVKLGELNSRMTDFFDIWLLSRAERETDSWIPADDIAWKSNQVARCDIYASLQIPIEPWQPTADVCSNVQARAVELDSSYMDHADAVAGHQLAKAGFRLPSLLNEIWTQPIAPDGGTHVTSGNSSTGDRPVSSNLPASVFVGNLRSKIYARPGCGTYDRMAPQNRVVFPSREAAE
jgi:predicted nucleotidyltransferase component of viral defense system